MTAFHEPDYISFLRHVTPDNQVRNCLQAGRASDCSNCPSAANSASAAYGAVHGVLMVCRGGMLACHVARNRLAMLRT